MKNLLTLEFNPNEDVIEIHLNKVGAEYLINNLNRLIKNGENEHIHLLTPEWGGNELTTEKQNLNEETQLIHHLKIMYWNE